MIRIESLRSAAKWTAPLLLLALVAGCTLVGVGYRQLDTLAGWKAGEYVTLDAQQKEEFSTRFRRLHAWHRYEQLPDYVNFLASTKTRVEGGFERGDVLAVMRGAEDRYRTLVQRGADDAAALLATLTPAQVESLQRRWQKDNLEFAERLRLDAGPDEQRQARAERELRRLREWVGPLSREQEKRIVALSYEMPLSQRLHYEDRVRRQREFLQIMAQRNGDPAQFAARLRHWLLNWEEGRNPEYRRAAAEWRVKQADLYVEVERMLLPQQRAHLVRRLDRFINDFSRLAQRPGEAQAAGR